MISKRSVGAVLAIALLAQIEPTVAQTGATDIGLCPKGAAVSVLYSGTWYPAKVLDGPDRMGACLVSYDGFGSSWDEWVNGQRMRLLGQSAAASNNAARGQSQPAPSTSSERNPLGMEWAVSPSSQPAAQASVPTSGGLDVEWPRGDRAQPAQPPSSTDGGLGIEWQTSGASKPTQSSAVSGGGLGIEWQTGSSTRQPSPSTQPTTSQPTTSQPTTSPPATQAGGLGVDWKTGSITQPTQPIPPPPTAQSEGLGLEWRTGSTQGAQTAPTNPTGGISTSAPSTTGSEGGACPPEPVPVMPANNVTSFYPDYVSGHHHGFQDAWRRNAEQRTPPPFEVTRVSEHYRSGYYDGLKAGDLAWKSWRAANPRVQCTSSGSQTNSPPAPVAPTDPKPELPPSSTVSPERATLWAWGANQYGQLNASPIGQSTSPIPVFERPLRAVAGGGGHTLLLDASGIVWTVGRNENGELGDPSVPTGRGNSKALRTAATPVAGLSGITAVAAGGGHALALRGDGTVWSWGYNGFFYPVAPKAGQLGTDAVEIGTSPRKVETLNDVVAIAAGVGHSVALRRDGTVWVWGSNAYGQLGDGTAPRAAGDVTSWRAAAAQVGGLTDVIAIAAGGYHTLALKRNGTVWSWGHHGNGQLGGGAYPDPSCVRPKSSFDPLFCTRPVQVLGSYGRSAALTNVKAITAGGNASLALLHDGFVVGWGESKYDQIGTSYRQKYPDFPSADPKWVNRGTPGVFAPLPVDEWDPSAPGVKPLANVAAISAGSTHTLVLKRDGSVWSLGGNTMGQLGVEHTGNFKDKYPYAFPVPGLTGIQLIHAGGMHSLAVTGRR